MSSHNDEAKVVAAATLRIFTHLFEILDTSADGLIDPSDFDEMLQDKIVKTWFSAIRVGFDEAHELFNFTDDGDGNVSSAEFTTGIKSVRGLARGVDLMMPRRAVIEKMDVVFLGLDVHLLEVDNASEV